MIVATFESSNVPEETGCEAFFIRLGANFLEHFTNSLQLKGGVWRLIGRGAGCHCGGWASKENERAMKDGADNNNPDAQENLAQRGEPAVTKPAPAIARKTTRAKSWSLAPGHSRASSPLSKRRQRKIPASPVVFTQQDYEELVAAGVFRLVAAPATLPPNLAFSN